MTDSNRADVLERPYTAGGGVYPPPPYTPPPPPLLIRSHTPPPLPMFAADSQNFASAPSVPRGFKLQKVWPAFSGDHRGRKGSQPNPLPPLRIHRWGWPSRRAPLPPLRRSPGHAACRTSTTCAVCTALGPVEVGGSIFRWSMEIKFFSLRFWVGGWCLGEADDCPAAGRVSVSTCDV